MLMNNIAAAILPLLAVNSVICTLGIDVSSIYQTSTFQCLKSQGHLFAIVSGYHPSGTLDKNALPTIMNAVAGAGMLGDLKFRFCRGKEPVSQIQQMMAHIPKTLYSTVWIQVKNNQVAGCGWQTHDPPSNCLYVSKLVAAVQRKQKAVGIFSSKEEWTKIFNGPDECQIFKELPLWYSNNNKAADFSDYPEFGGWQTPQLKQFQLNASACDATFNRNFHPSA